MTEDKPWLSLPDEEPPDRGLADLMAAARMKAEVMANPPWWRRLFDVLRRPPVLALATIVVLLGGVIVVGRHPEKTAAPSEQPVATPPAGPEIHSESIVNEVAPPVPPPAAPPSVSDVPPQRVTAPKHLSKSPAVMHAAPELNSAFEGADEATVQAPVQAPVQKGAAQKVVTDPLARCRAAANRKDCAGAKACAHEVEKADPSYYRANATQDAALKSCL